MGWKNIRAHYRIGHTVFARDGKVFIGSAYVPELLVVSPGGKVEWGVLGPASNDDLTRVHAEMTADPAKLAALFEEPDTFAADLPVFTFKDGEIIEQRCEKHGYPSITHEGHIQYENSHFAEKADAISAAKEDADAWVKLSRRCVDEAETKLASCYIALAESQNARARLEADYPSPPSP